MVLLPLACMLASSQALVAMPAQRGHGAIVTSPTNDGPPLPPARALFASLATPMVRMERLVAIGRLCRSLSEEQSTVIIERASGELREVQHDLNGEDRVWADVYLAGLRTGAFQAAQLTDAIDEASCRRFVEPGGTLTKLLTWTDEPQEVAPGLLATPGTVP